MPLSGCGRLDASKTVSFAATPDFRVWADGDVDDGGEQERGLGRPHFCRGGLLLLMVDDYHMDGGYARGRSSAFGYSVSLCVFFFPV